MALYVRFEWDRYYPEGGCGDIVGVYEDVEAATATGVDARRSEYGQVVRVAPGAHAVVSRWEPNTLTWIPYSG